MGTEFWAAHVAAAKLEAIPASEYARRHGFAVKSLYDWHRKLVREDKTGASVSVNKFVALRIAPGAACQNYYTLELTCGLRLEIMSALPSPEWLAAVSRAAQQGALMLSGCDIACVNTVIAQLRQRMWVTFPGNDGADDVLSRFADNVGEHVGQLHIHLRERLLHALNLPGLLAKQGVALTGYGA